ncbi:hypothetical protein OF83DRAFT_1177297 [Amylostereum chailletii]|nr:hypothetical protein OF83DRAFT_1177297 [Amylostereum chailletii]
MSSVAGTDTAKSAVADTASTDTEIVRRTRALRVSEPSNTSNASTSENQADSDVVMPDPSATTSGSADDDYLERAFQGIDLDDEDGSDFDPDAAGSEDSEDSSEDEDGEEDEDDDDGELASGDEEIAAKGRPRKTLYRHGGLSMRVSLIAFPSREHRCIVENGGPAQEYTAQTVN